MVEREDASAADVAGVRGAGGVAAREGGGHRGVADDSGPSAVADGLILAVPAGDGKPHFELDVGIAGWRERRGDAAEFGEHGVGIRGSAFALASALGSTLRGGRRGERVDGGGRGYEGSGGYDCGGGDGRAGEFGFRY